jgi:hypothetical protein
MPYKTLYCLTLLLAAIISALQYASNKAFFFWLPIQRKPLPVVNRYLEIEQSLAYAIISKQMLTNCERVDGYTSSKWPWFKNVSLWVEGV